MKINETETFKRFVGLHTTNKPTHIFTHHSGGTDANPLEDTSHHTAQIMESWHLKKGWDGLGYQYVIHKDGVIWAGRPEHRHGAHVKGFNSKSIGICIIGNFDLTEPTKAQIKSLKWLLKDVMSRHDIPVENILPHRSHANKTCHGNKLPDNWGQTLVAKPIATPTNSCKNENEEIKGLKELVDALVNIIRSLFKK